MSKSCPVLTLKPSREKSVVRFHPWIFSGAVAKVDGTQTDRGPVDVVDSDGTWLARGLWHPSADLAVRIYTWNENESLDANLITERVKNAVELRKEVLGTNSRYASTDSYRLVFSEADGLSGFIADRYADTIAATISARGLTPYVDALLTALSDCTGIKTIRLMASPDAVAREGIDAEAVTKLSTGSASRVRIRENDLAFDVNIEAGQKTGFYLDQRENRLRTAAFAAGRRVLSAYCYTGAFDVYAAKAGAASIHGLDTSNDALDHARLHYGVNGLSTPATYEKADVPVALRRFRDEGRTFDMIILDPPCFVFSSAQKEKGMRAYKDINLLAMKLLTPGGILASFSCSGLVSSEDFKTVIRWASVDACRAVKVLETLGQSFDHPILATFPEGEYLKGMICRVERQRYTAPIRLSCHGPLGV